MKSVLLPALATLTLGAAALRADTPSPTPTVLRPVPMAVKPAAAVSPTPVPTLPPKLASDETVKQLLEVTRVRQLVDSIQPYLDGASSRQAHSVALQKHLTPAQQAAFNAAVAKNLADYKAQVTWEKLEPTYVDAYSRTFTEEQTKAITAFYQTDAGQALLTKLSGVMRSVMTGTQMQMQSLLQRMSKDMQAAAAQAIAENPAPSPTPTAVAPKGVAPTPVGISPTPVPPGAK
jgi:hypothetical protein